MAEKPTAAPKAKPRIAILERRLQNPFGESSQPIDLKDPAYEARWFNAALASDRIWRAKRQGWDPIRPDEVMDLDQVGGYTVGPDGFIARGDRGQEVLMKMPKNWRIEIQAAKTKANLRTVGDPNAAKSEIVAAAGQKLGDRAATFLDKSLGVVGGVTDQYERIERIEPAE